MSTKQLNFKSLPVIAAADGATSPALTASDKGALAFSTTISKALMWDGTKWSSSGLKGDTGATGSVSAADQTKLNGIQAGATANATDAQLRDRSTHTGAQAIATVTGLQSMLDGKSSTTHTHAAATTTVAGFMSDADKVKLDGVAAGANNFTYAHPANHPASVIVQDASNRFVTDTEKAAWNAKQPAGTYATGTGTASGTNTGDQTTITGNAGSATTLSTGADRTKLDGIAAGANNFTYAHPANHPASIIAQDASNRFVTDAEKSSWNAKIGSVKTINGQPIVGSGDLVLAASNSFPVDIWVNGVVFGRGGGNKTENTSSGSSALSQNTGIQNTAYGFQALQLNTTANGNTANGFLTLWRNTTGAGNTATGATALQFNTTGSINTAVGDKALNGNTTGAGNTAVGRGALEKNTTGSYNVFLGSAYHQGGYFPVFNCTVENNRVAIGHTLISNAYIQVPWTVVSDARDKTNFKAIPHGLDFVKQLKPTAYQFRTDRASEKTNGGVRYGFKAQDIAAIEPEAVIVDTTNPEKLYYNESNLIPILVKAIQELSAEVERLKNANSNT
jgi:hypothetical protein